MCDSFYIQFFFAIFILATGKFRRRKVFSIFEIETWWCMTCVNNLAKDKNSVKCLLVHQDLIDGSIVTKGEEMKECKKTVRTN